MTAVTTRVFRLPDLGEGLTEAGLVQWLVAVGDTVATDQAIAEVETAKSVVELPSPFAGVVTALHGEPGETIDVGAPVLEVADGDAGPSAGSSAQVEHDAYREEERAGSGNVLIGYGTTERGASGRRRPRVQTPARSTPSAGTPTAMTATEPEPAPSTETERKTVRSDSDAPARRAVAVRSPLVRRLARDLGIDVHAIAPTGHDGAVTRADVLAAAVDVAVDGAAASHHGSPVGIGRPGGGREDSDARADAALRGDVVDGLPVASRERMSACARPSARNSRAAAPRSPRPPSGSTSMRPTCGRSARRWHQRGARRPRSPR